MVSIEDGYVAIFKHDAPKDVWIAKKLVVNTRTFVTVDKQNHGCDKYLKGDFDMSSTIADSRNAEVDNLMEARWRTKMEAGGSGCDTADLQHMPRRQLADEIDRICTVQVRTHDNVEYTVRVLTCAPKRQKLALELTESNMLLLTSKPLTHDDVNTMPQPDTSELKRSFTNVAWIPSRRSLRIRYWTMEKQGYTIKSTPVAADPRDTFQERCMEIARNLEAEYASCHVNPPPTTRKRKA